MKKVLLAVAVVAFFASCKKDYVCTCSSPGETDELFQIKDAKKSDAKDACDTFNSLAIIGGGSCSLN
jgi:hypothetical protein